MARDVIGEGINVVELAMIGIAGYFVYKIINGIPQFVQDESAQASQAASDIFSSPWQMFLSEWGLNSYSGPPSAGNAQ
jgi:hypothetical protein